MSFLYLLQSISSFQYISLAAQILLFKIQLYVLKLIFYTKYPVALGFVNFISLHKLSLYLIDLSIPLVIHADCLCLCLLNVAILYGICLTLAMSISLIRML